MSKAYIGDGLYANFDGYNLILTSEDGYRVLDRIVLEPAVYRNMRDFAKRQIGLEDEEKER